MTPEPSPETLNGLSFIIFTCFNGDEIHGVPQAVMLQVFFYYVFLLIIGLFRFSVSSQVSLDNLCFLGICPFPLGYLIFWYTIIHSILL